MIAAQIKPVRCYKCNPSFDDGDVIHTTSNTLNSGFNVAKPNKAWLTDLTYISPHKSWLYLTVVTELFSIQFIGMPMKSTAEEDLVIDALMIAIWRCFPIE